MEYTNEKIQRFVKSEIRKNKRKREKPCTKKTPEELLAVLKRVGGETRLTEVQYRKKKDYYDPNPLTYYRRFGSWNNACEMVWGKKKLTPKEILFQKYDETYMVKLINEFNIKDIDQYLEKRALMPDIFPTKYLITKLFKNFTNLLKASERFSLDEQLMKCLHVRLEMGKCPSLDDYRKAGINVDMLLKKYYSQRQINKRIRVLEEAYERKRRDKIEDDESYGEMFKREEKKTFIPFSEQLRI